MPRARIADIARRACDLIHVQIARVSLLEMAEVHKSARASVNVYCTRMRADSLCVMRFVGRGIKTNTTVPHREGQQDTGIGVSVCKSTYIYICVKCAAMRDMFAYRNDWDTCDAAIKTCGTSAHMEHRERARMIFAQSARSGTVRQIGPKIYMCVVCATTMMLCCVAAGCADRVSLKCCNKFVDTPLIDIARARGCRTANGRNVNKMMMRYG